MRNWVKSFVAVLFASLLLTAFPTVASAREAIIDMLYMNSNGDAIVYVGCGPGAHQTVFFPYDALVIPGRVEVGTGDGTQYQMVFDMDKLPASIEARCRVDGPVTSLTIDASSITDPGNTVVRLSAPVVAPGGSVTATLTAPPGTNLDSAVTAYRKDTKNGFHKEAENLHFNKATGTVSYTFTVPGDDPDGVSLIGFYFDKNLRGASVKVKPLGLYLFEVDLADLTVAAGEPAVFSVKHSIPSSYQVETVWRVYDGTGWEEPNPAKLNFAVDHSDPANPTLTIIPTAAQDGLLVRSGAVAQPGDIMEFSRQATLTVTGQNPLHFTKHPESVQVLPGYAYTFSYDHDGNPAPLWAIWQVNTGSGWNIPDPAAVNYAAGYKFLDIIPNVSQYNMQVRVMLVKPDMTTLISNPARLMSPDYAIIQMPQTQAVKVNTLARFSVDYVGAPGTLFWQYSLDGANWLMFDPATVNYAAYGQTLDIVPTVALDGAYIRVTIYGINGEVLTSTPARLWVLL